MSLVNRLFFRVHSKQAAEVNTNGRWPSGKEDLQFFALMFVIVCSTWIYGLHLVIID